MRTPWTQLFLHLVWATWDRHPFLTSDIRQRVYGCLQQECAALGCDVIAIGGMDDHVHLLVQVPATIAPAELVRRVKGASSHLINHEIRPGERFKWQGGYGAFSVSKRNVPLVRDYVLNQEQHHRDGTAHPAVEV
jgi:putative transposase